MKIKTIIRRILIFILTVIIFVCSYKIYNTLHEYQKADNIYNNLRKQKEQTIKETNSNIDGNSSSNDSKKNNSKSYTLDLSSISKDFICWINIENTNIDYPVLQSNDNSYYLHRDIHGNYLYSGTLFLDYRDNYNKSKNLIIYGHNMKNTTMFSEIEKFKDESFFNSKPTVTLIDKNKERHYEVFAVLLVKKDYGYTITNFNNDKEYTNFLNNICNASLYKVKNKPTTSDQIITLTTCSYEFENARTVIVCKEKK